MSYNVSNPVPRQHGARSTTIVNDAYFPGPGGKMHSWKRNLALELAQTKLPKKVYDHGEIDHASEILELPRSYESIDAKILTPPPGKTNDPGGVQTEAIKVKIRARLARPKRKRPATATTGGAEAGRNRGSKARL